MATIGVLKGILGGVCGVVEEYLEFRGNMG